MMLVFGLLAGIIPLIMLFVEIIISYVAVGVALVMNVGIGTFNPNAKSVTGD